MAFRVTRLITFIGAVCLSFFLVDARSWDLAVTIGKEVQFFANNGTSMGRITTSEAVDLGGIAYDNTSRIMFLSDRKNASLTIFSKNLSTKDLRMLHSRKNRTAIVGLVYDQSTQTLFWTDIKEGAILSMRVSKNESNEPTTLLKLPNKMPHGISLDVCNRRLYWTNSNKTNPSIESSNLDGSNRTIVIGEKLYEPLGVVVDHVDGRLYWIDDEEGVDFKVESSDLDGNDRQLLYHGRNHQPYSIATDRGNIYWADWTSRAIWRMEKNFSRGASSHPTEWVSFHRTNQDSDPKSIVTRDNSGSHNCAAMKHNAKIKNISAMIHPHEPDNLATSTEEGDSDKANNFKCLNEGVHDPLIDKCKCKPGFEGIYCERSMCYNYCFHGECFITSGGQPRCKCSPLYQGPRCEQNICIGHCLNDGKCSIRNGEPYCTCQNSRGPRCEELFDLDKICSVFCLSGVNALNSIDTSSCRCENATESIAQMSAYVDDLWCKTLIIVLSILLGVLTLLVGILSYYVNKLRRQPRIRKRIVVNKSGVTPLTSRPQLSGEQCEITIENCCNMNICETPCFEPKIRSPTPQKNKKEEKNSLLENMEGNSC